jgi:hypothetical protein
MEYKVTRFLVAMAIVVALVMVKESNARSESDVARDARVTTDRFIATTSAATTLNPAEHLRKMSLRVRGVLPDRAEFEELLLKQTIAEQNAFLKRKAEEYAKTRWAAQKLSERVSEDLRISTLERNPLQDPRRTTRIDSTPKDAVDVNLVRDSGQGYVFSAIRTSRSLRELYLGRDFRIGVLTSSYVSELLRDRQASLLGFVRKAKAHGYDISKPTEVEAAMADLKETPERFGEFRTQLSDAGLIFETINELQKHYPTINIKERLMPDVGQLFAGPTKTARRRSGSNPPGDHAKRDWVMSNLGFRGYSHNGVSIAFDMSAFPATQRIRLNFSETRRLWCLLDEAYARFGGVWSVGRFCDIPEADEILGLPGTMANKARIFEGIDQGDFDSVITLILGGISTMSEDELKEFAKSHGSNHISFASGPLDISRSMAGIEKTKFSPAAAMHRILLCDSMSVQVSEVGVSKAQKLQSLLNVTGGTTPQSAYGDVSSSNAPAYLQPQCMECHKKLNPVERVLAPFFPTTASQPLQEPQPFVIQGLKKEDVVFEANNYMEFLQALAKQPQFVRCQTEKFWNWYVGSDVAMSPSVRQELESEFARSDFDFRKLIAVLVTRPEFAQAPPARRVVDYSEVEPILNRCTSCHETSNRWDLDLTPPYNIFRVGDPASHGSHPLRTGYVRNLQKMITATNLLEDGIGARMPPRPANPLSADQRELLLRWVSAGAPQSEAGPRVLTTAEVQTLLAAAKPSLRQQLSEPIPMRAKFKGSWLRYLENYDLFKVLGQVSPISAQRVASCTLREGQLLLLGFNDASSGAPVRDSPSGAYFDRVKKCASDVATANVSEIVNRNLVRSKDLILNAIHAGRRWNEIDASVRHLAIQEMAEAIYGLGVLSASEMNEHIEVIDQALGVNQRLGIYEAIAAMFVLHVVDDRFLTH